jgi:hypothetical protein
MNDTIRMRFNLTPRRCVSIFLRHFNSSKEIYTLKDHVDTQQMKIFQIPSDSIRLFFDFKSPWMSCGLSQVI